MKKPTLLILFFVSTVVVLSVGRVAVLNSISTTGIELVSLQQKVDSYKKQNTLLREQYLEASSLNNIESQAKKMGFIPSKTQIYLSTPLPLALKQ